MRKHFLVCLFLMFVAAPVGGAVASDVMGNAAGFPGWEACRALPVASGWAGQTFF